MSPSKFLITGARAPAALQLARILGRSGHEVILADSLKHCIAYRSRWIHGHAVLPPPATQFPQFTEAARKTIACHQPHFILCTCEEIFYWAKAAEQEPGAFRPYFKANPDFKTLRMLHHKGVFARLARSIAAEAGVLVPETRIRRLSEPGHRWVGKPAYSRFAVMTRLGLTASQAGELLQRKNWLVQRQIEGREFCTWAFFVNGAEVSSTAYEPLYRAGRGSGIGLRAVDPGPAASFARLLAKRLNYTGQLAFDWIRNDHGCHVLECNPRATSGVHFLERKSEETATALAQALTGLPFHPVLGEQEDVAIKWAMLMFGAKHKFAAHYRRFLRNARDADRVKDDPRPTSPVAIASALAEIITRAVRHRIGLIQASTADIEWNGQVLWREK